LDRCGVVLEEDIASDEVNVLGFEKAARTAAEADFAV